MWHPPRSLSTYLAGGTQRRARLFERAAYTESALKIKSSIRRHKRTVVSNAQQCYLATATTSSRVLQTARNPQDRCATRRHARNRRAAEPDVQLSESGVAGERGSSAAGDPNDGGRSAWQASAEYQSSISAIRVAFVVAYVAAQKRRHFRAEMYTILLDESSRQPHQDG